MSPEDYWEIITHDVAGTNPDPKKAEQMRNFVIPERLNIRGSSPTRPRTIKIFGAFVSKSWVWVLCDFSGLMRLHVKTRQGDWRAEDLAVGSKVRELYRLKLTYQLCIISHLHRNGTKCTKRSKGVQIHAVSGQLPNPVLTAGVDRFKRNARHGRERWLDLPGLLKGFSILTHSSLWLGKGASSIFFFFRFWFVF